MKSKIYVMLGRKHSFAVVVLPKHFRADRVGA